jgi:hypothetical protein
MANEIFIKQWEEAGAFIARGNPITSSDLYAVYDMMDIGNIRPEFLPGEKTVTGTASERKDEILRIARRLWSFSASDWLTMENTWLRKAREVTGSQETKGKDKTNDIVSAEILVRIVAAAKLVMEDKQDRYVTNEAIRAINLILQEVCAKGRTRMEMVDEKSVYSILRNGGLAFGTGGGKYLPNPQVSLPRLLCFLHKDSVDPLAYIK